jgi:diadenosine tetraphosphatase ApaH/serine/threonine PP2A family protein phosphatase
LRYLILSDIHANVDALEAVLNGAAGSWDRVVVLGDLVGYGAEPNAVIDRVRALDPVAVIRGNHDKAACGLEDASNFNQIARTAAAWTFETLTDDNRQYLRDLPSGPITLDDTVEICHGAPFDEDHYIFDGDDALRALEAGTRPLCLFGHTHLPVIFRRSEEVFDGFVPEGEQETRVPLAPAARYLVNPGSVGQPRDGDPRAAFAIYDSDGPSLILHRLAYPVETAQRRIRTAGLPPSLANRLAIGR